MTSPTHPQKRSIPSWLWMLLGGIIFALGIIIFMASSPATITEGEDSHSAAAEVAPLVEVSPARSAAPVYTVTAPGRLQARQSLSVVGEVPGKIAYLNPNLQIGGRLARGDVLLRIESGDYQAELDRARAQLTTAQAALAQARSDYQRQAELARIGAVPAAAAEASQAALATAEASIAQAEAGIRLAERSVGKTTIRAPFDAIVTSENLSQDTYVSPGIELARLIDASAGVVEAGLSPADIVAVRRTRDQLAGQPVVVRAVANEGSLGQTELIGYLESFSPQIDPVSRTVAIRAVFPDAFQAAYEGQIFAGDFMNLELAGMHDGNLFEVPNAAIRRNALVWALDDDNRLVRIDITPIETHEHATLVASEAQLDGRRVLVTPLAEETAGLVVRPRPNAELRRN